MSRHGHDGITDYNGTIVVPYSCMDDDCFSCRLLIGGTEYDKPCPRSPAGKMIARSKEVIKTPAPVDLSKCSKCLRYMARNREPGGMQQCVECCLEESGDAEWSEKHGIPLAKLRGPLADLRAVELLGLTSEECGEVVQRNGKISRWGWDADHDGTTQQHKLEVELGDVLAATILLIHNGYITKEGVINAMHDKLNKLRADAAGPRQRLQLANVPDGESVLIEIK